MKVKTQVSVQCLRLPPESDIMHLFNSTQFLFNMHTKHETQSQAQENSSKQNRISS